MHPLIILTGPTTTGKSAVALELAEQLDGEIINADSMQVYRHFDIGTAKPSPEGRRRVPHHLIDILRPDEETNAFEFKTRALAVIEDLRRRGKTPILTGGTGLYIKVLTENHDCAVQVSDETLALVRREIAERGPAACHEALLRVDPESASRITPADRMRIERALAVYRQTGKKMSDFHAAENTPEHAFPVHGFLFEWDRGRLYEKINQRVDSMIEAGWVNEVRGLLAMGLSPDLKPMKSIGYAELNRHLAGDISLERAVYEIKRETRHYAKRQITWFKKMRGLLGLPAGDDDTPKSLMEKILAHLPGASCLLLALLLVLAPAAKSLASEASELLEGAAWLEAGQLQQAENRFQNLAHSAQDRQVKKRARYLLARATLAEGRHGEARELLTASLDEYRDIADYIHLDLARLALAEGKGERALGEIDTLLARYPESVLAHEARLMRLDIFEQGGEPRKAIRALTDLLGDAASPAHNTELKPWVAELEMRLAELHLGLGQNGQAYQWLRHLAIDHPAEPPGRQTFADYRRLAAMADVIAHPLSLGETRRRVLNLMNGAMYQAALDEIEALALATPELPDDFIFYRARAYQRTGRRPLANETLAGFVRDNPKHLRVQEALFEQGRNLWNLNRDEDALASLMEVQRKNKVSKWAERAQFVMARIHESNRREDEALRHYQILLKRYRNGRFTREAAWRLGWIRYKQGKYTEAHRLFESNSRNAYGSWAVSNLYWAGKSAERMGRPETARKLYSRLAELHPFSFFGLRARENLVRLGLPDDTGAPRLIPISYDEALPLKLRKPLDAGDLFHLSRGEELIALGLPALARAEIARLERPLSGELAGVMRLSALYNRAQAYPDALRVLQIHKNSVSAGRSLPEVFWKNYYPVAYGELIEPRARANGIDPFFVNSLIRQESLFDPRALSPAGARGLMQIMPETGRRVHAKTSSGDLYDAELLFDPETNIDLGIQYLRQLTEEFGGEKTHLLISYNAGPHVLKKWLKRFESIDDPDVFVESLPYPETRNYVKRVMGNYAVYKILYPPARKNQ